MNTGFNAKFSPLIATAITLSGTAITCRSRYPLPALGKFAAARKMFRA
jgi:hypothetical protein